MMIWLQEATSFRPNHSWTSDACSEKHTEERCHEGAELAEPGAPANGHQPFLSLPLTAALASLFSESTVNLCPVKASEN